MRETEGKSPSHAKNQGPLTLFQIHFLLGLLLQIPLINLDFLTGCWVVLALSSSSPPNQLAAQLVLGRKKMETSFVPSQW